MRFGIIGAGAVATLHAQAIQACAQAELVGVADAREEAARAFCARYGGLAYTSLQALLDDPQIEAVCVCTPSGLHAEQAIQAAENGKHALIEKPLALTVEDAQRVMEAAARNRVTMGVISQYRFSVAFQRLKEAVNQGRLGRLVSAEILMKYYRSPAYYASSGWRGTWAMDGGGALMNQGIHGIDALLSIMGPVRHVYGLTRTLAHDIEVEDTAAAVLEFHSGALGIIQGTTSVYPGYPRKLAVSGTRGTIGVTENLFTTWDIEGEEMPPDIALGGSQRSGASEPMNLDAHNHALHIHDFMQAVQTGCDPIVPLREAREVIGLITAIYESSRRGVRVDLDSLF